MSHKGDYAALPLVQSTVSDTGPRKKGSYSAGLAVVKALLFGIGLFVCLNAVGLAPRASYPRWATDRLQQVRPASEHPWQPEAQCAQATAVVPTRHAELWSSLGDTYGTDAFKSRAAEWLGAAVRVPTETYDGMGPVGEDERWEAFGAFHEHLLGAFPLTHSSLELTKVNTYGLVYVWKGSDESLKPLLLLAHQDVVPVNPDTVDEWTHPPYSGYFDGQRIWGRGSFDDKSGLIGILSSVESLLEAGFRPTRGVVLGFGFDEEIGGRHGAALIGKHLEKTYGQNSFLLLVDEGGGFGNLYGGVIAAAAVAEKGQLSVEVEVASPGGHSSIPPDHTSIGILSRLLVHVEENPSEAQLSRGTPVYWMAQCLAAYAPGLPDKLREDLKESVESDEALHAAQEELFKIAVFRALAGTTQAVTLVNGGVKANALPEQARAVINHRIASYSSVSAVQAHDTGLLKGLAADFNLSYTAFGVPVSEQDAPDAPARGALTLRNAWGSALEPAPVSPLDAPEYALFSGTIKATYNAHRNLAGDGDVAVAPSIMPWNTGAYRLSPPRATGERMQSTAADRDSGLSPAACRYPDSRWYWALTDHIYRYNHVNLLNATASGNGVHTVNEFFEADGFVEQIRFFTTLILNADEFAQA